MGRLFQLFRGKGWGFPGIGPLATFWPFTVSLLELSWHLWVCYLAYANVLQCAYNEAQGLLAVESSAILDLIGSNQFMLYSQQLFHSFKGCALPSSLLFHLHNSIYSRSLLGPCLSSLLPDPIV